MAKHRKTRRQKIRSDNRQEHVFATPLEETAPVQEKRSFSFTFSPYGKEQAPSRTPKNPTNAYEYSFVKHDLIKTSVVVGSIVIAELLLFVTI